MNEPTEDGEDTEELDDDAPTLRMRLEELPHHAEEDLPAPTV